MAELKQAEIEQREKAELEYAKAKKAAAQRLKDNYPPEPIGDTGLTTESAWDLTLEKLETQLTPAMYKTFLKDTMLVQMAGSEAHVVVSNQYTVEYLSRRFYQSIARTLSSVIGTNVDVEFLANDEVFVGAVEA